MKRENLIFLAGGFAFGILFGFALYRGVMEPPADPAEGAATTGSSVPSPAGPMAPTQAGEGAGLPSSIMEELQLLKRQLEQDPDDLSALVRAGDMLFRMGLWDEALRFYERGLEVNRNPDLLTVSGLCYREMRQFDEALERFSEAHRLDPSHWESLYNTAVVTGIDLGQFEKAEATLRELEAQDPSNTNLEELREAIGKAREEGNASPPARS